MRQPRGTERPRNLLLYSVRGSAVDKATTQADEYRASSLYTIRGRDKPCWSPCSSSTDGWRGLLFPANRTGRVLQLKEPQVNTRAMKKGFTAASFTCTDSALQRGPFSYGKIQKKSTSFPGQVTMGCPVSQSAKRIQAPPWTKWVVRLINKISSPICTQTCADNDMRWKNIDATRYIHDKTKRCVYRGSYFAQTPDISNSYTLVLGRLCDASPCCNRTSAVFGCQKP